MLAQATQRGERDIGVSEETGTYVDATECHSKTGQPNGRVGPFSGYPE